MTEKKAGNGALFNQSFEGYEMFKKMKLPAMNVVVWVGMISLVMAGLMIYLNNNNTTVRRVLA